MDNIKKIMNKLLNKETISYLFWGVVTTIVNIAVLYVCKHFLGIEVWLGNIIAWIVAVLVAFISNKLFVFESKSMIPAVVLKEATAFVIARLFSFAFDEAFMVISVYTLGMNELIAKIIANIVVVIINYILSKLFIFKKNED